LTRWLWESFAMLDDCCATHASPLKIGTNAVNIKPYATGSKADEFSIANARTTLAI